MPNNKNKQTLEEIRTKVNNAKSVVFTEYHGLKAYELNELRAKIRQTGSEMLVAKNTLLKIALREKGYSSELDQLSGPVATVLAYNDPIAPIKVLTEFAKKFQLPKLRFGFLENTYIDEANLQNVSLIPDKPVLISKLLGSLKSPLTGIVSVMSGTQRKFVYALAEIAKQKEV